MARVVVRTGVRVAAALVASAGLAPFAAAEPTRPAEREDRVVMRVALPDGRVAVVAEGDLEPRERGSYTVSLYDPAKGGDDAVRFVAGMSRPREGTLQSAVVRDLDRDGRAELVVVLRGDPGAGAVSAEAYSFGRNRIARRAGVSGLRPEADPVAALAGRVRRATAP